MWQDFLIEFFLSEIKIYQDFLELFLNFYIVKKHISLCYKMIFHRDSQKDGKDIWVFITKPC